MGWLSFGLNLLGGYGQYQADKASAKAAKAWQAYSNTMIRLSDAVNQNAITTNEILSQQAFADQAIGIKQSNILTTAQAEVSAAAAGVKGVSVDDVLLDINRNAANAENKRQNDLKASRLAFDQQRQSSALSAALQQDYSYIPSPKLGSYLLNAATKSFGGGGGGGGSQNIKQDYKPNAQGHVEIDWTSPQTFAESGWAWAVNRYF